MRITKSITYNKMKNYFVNDESGQIIYDIFNWITPLDLYRFKKWRRDITVKMSTNRRIKIDIWYPKPETPEEIFLDEQGLW